MGSRRRGTLALPQQHPSAAPTSPGAPGGHQELSPAGPPPLPWEQRQQLRAQLSDTRSAPAATRSRRARSSTQHLSHCFGTKSLRELAPPDHPLLPCPILTAHSKLNCTKASGSHTEPNKASLCPGPLREPDVHLSPPQGNASSGERIDGGARSSHQLPREEALAAFTTSILLQPFVLLLFSKALGLSTPQIPASLPAPHHRARRQISAKRQRRLRSPSWHGIHAGLGIFLIQRAERC